MHADHAGRQRVSALHRAAAHDRDGNRRIHFFREFTNFIVGTASDHAAAADDQRFFGLLDHLHELIHVSRIRGRSLEVFRSSLHQLCETAAVVMLFFCKRLVISLCCRNVFQNVKKDRPRTSASCNCKGFADRIRQLVYVSDNEVALCDRHRDSGDIHFLERILTDQAFTDIAGNKDHRRRIHVSRCDSCCQIGCARSAGRKADSYLTRASRVAIGCMRCALLVGSQNMTDLVTVLIQSIVDIQDRSARIAEDGIHTLFEQTFHYDLCSCHLHK